MDNILEIRDVTKRYNQKVAVDHVNLDIPRGAIFGMLGPNGAGKTSLIRMITTITRPDEGVILFNGKPLDVADTANTGYMPEERGLYKKMKVGEQLMYLGQLRGLTSADAKNQIKHWFQKFEITDWWGKKVEELSKGMQQKVQFIATILHRPSLIILDEPFTGLDPINSNLIKEEIHQLRKEGATIIFSTHRMEQVEEICEKIVLINEGKNILFGAVSDLKNSFKENLFEYFFDGSLPDSITQYATVLHNGNGNLKVRLSENQDSNALLKHLLNSGVHVTGFNEILPTMNEIFIKSVEGDSLAN